MVKIDRSFMQELTGNAENQAKIREIAVKADEAGIETIAEYVQDAASMTFLFGSGVGYVQGNFLAPSGPDMNYEFE